MSTLEIFDYVVTELPPPPPQLRVEEQKYLKVEG